MKACALMIMSLFLFAGCPVPRDEHPERTPSPEPSLQVGHQPAPTN
jgi:hypothetical protein